MSWGDDARIERELEEYDREIEAQRAEAAAAAAKEAQEAMKNKK